MQATSDGIVYSYTVPALVRSFTFTTPTSAEVDVTSNALQFYNPNTLIQQTPYSFAQLFDSGNNLIAEWPDPTGLNFNDSLFSAGLMVLPAGTYTITTGVMDYEALEFGGRKGGYIPPDPTQIYGAAKIEVLPTAP